ATPVVSSPAVPLKACGAWPGRASDTLSPAIWLCSVIVTTSPCCTTRTGPGAVAEPAALLVEKPQIGIGAPRTVVVPVIEYRSQAATPAVRTQPAGARRPTGAAGATV